jgi:hypothetical protein
MRVLIATLSMCLAVLCVWVVAAAAGTDLRGAGTPSAAASEQQKAQIAELDKLLEEARKLKLAIEAGEGEEGAEKAEVVAESSPQYGNDIPVTPATRPGCMYRGNQLLWERRPGSCPPRPPG